MINMIIFYLKEFHKLKLQLNNIIKHQKCIMFLYAKIIFISHLVHLNKNYNGLLQYCQYNDYNFLHFGPQIILTFRI
jgi:hypothetical protein